MIAILADDLTSALDGAAPFAAHGQRSAVLLDRTDSIETELDVHAVDLDSRFETPAVARLRSFDAARRLTGAAILLKTIDSTLRGNLAAEVAGALEGSGRRRAVVAPAFPDAGRTTAGGRQFVDGKAVETTAFGSDSRTPVRSSDLAVLLASIGSERLLICDAETDADLDAIVKAHCAEEVLWVGSPGLAGALARTVGPAGQRRERIVADAAGRVLVVVGSLHPGNATQIEALRMGGAPVFGVGCNGGAGVVAAIGRAASASPIVVVTTDPGVREPDGAAPARRLADIVAQAMESYDGLVVTGGDTARRVVDRLRARSIRLWGEIEPGVPQGLLHLPARAIRFATKAGGFGRPDTLARCADELRDPMGLVAG
jgi:uncharacterized protein YgbK (DUF1537 family)